MVKRQPHFQLVREVLCNVLAQMVELPVPTPFLLDVRECDDWVGDENFAFATRDAGHGDLLRPMRQSPTMVYDLVRWPKFLAATAFDEWIANEDRTLSNLLFAGRRDFILIDHGEALPNYMNAGTKLRNGLARHLNASENAAPREVLAKRVQEFRVNFGRGNWRQLETAALLGAWQGEPQFGECVRLLRARLNNLPTLIEEEFRVGQAQLLA